LQINALLCLLLLQARADIAFVPDQQPVQADHHLRQHISLVQMSGKGIATMVFLPNKVAFGRTTLRVAALSSIHLKLSIA